MEWPDLNIADAWDAITEVIPEADAVVCGDEHRSWYEFERRADAMAASWASRGIGRGSKVGLYLPNCIEYLEAQYATFKLGAVACNVNYRYTADELRYLLENADAEAIVFASHLADRVGAVCDGLPDLGLLVQVGGDPGPGFVTFDALIGENHGPAPTTGRSGDDLWFLYTGGTTGMPKAVMWPHSSLFGTMRPHFDGLRLPYPETAATASANVVNIHERGKVTRQLTGAPLMHGTASLAAMATLTQGGCVLMTSSPSFDADEFWEMTQRERVTNLVIVGDVFARPMVDSLQRAESSGAPYDIDSLRLVLSSGVMWSAPLKEALREFKPGLVLVDSLGSSEATNLGSDVVRGGDAPRTARFRLSDDAQVFTEAEKPVVPGSGERGLLAVGGPLPIGYYKDPVKTAATYRTIDGVRWSMAGDWATVEADGTITLLGRGSGCINTGGEKVYPEEVEETLKLHDDVVDCNVVGLPDERWGQRVTAVVEVRAGSSVSDDAIVDHARELISGYKLPKQIVRVPRLHRGPNGKSDYRWALRVAEAEALAED